MSPLCFVLTLVLSSAAPRAGHPPVARTKLTTRAPQKVLLVTHPTESVVRNYATLVRDHVIDVQNLQIVGIYHTSENEDYAASQAFIAKNKLTWMHLRPVRCALRPTDVFASNGCREEFSAILASADGLVLNGGADIQPSLYGQPQSMLTQVETPHRHVFEVALLVQLLGSSRAVDVQPLLQKRPNFPILGICVGMQTLNIAGGGTLIQDVPSMVYGQGTVESALTASPATWHRNHSHELGGNAPVYLGVMHPIHLTPDAPVFMRTAAADGNHEPQVLSIHHQAVDKLAPAYHVYGTSDDGKIIEVMGRHDFPNVLGIQFHPERSAMWEQQERALMDDKSTQYNFIYDAMAADVYTRTFNRGIWQWLSQQLIHPTACVAAPGS